MRFKLRKAFRRGILGFFGWGSELLGVSKLPPAQIDLSIAFETVELRPILGCKRVTIGWTDAWMGCDILVLPDIAAGSGSGGWTVVHSSTDTLGAVDRIIVG